MKRLRTLLFLTGAALLMASTPVFAQRGGHSAPAPHPNNTATGHDVLHAYGIGPNTGFHSGAPLTPSSGFAPRVGGYNPPVNFSAPLIGSPNTFFPSQTTGFSTAPLFPYATKTFPYGFGLLAREPGDETQPKPPAAASLHAQDSNSATMNVRVPPEAEIWFEGSKTGQHGATRTFVSPPLEPGRGFTYEIRARWTDNGKEVDQTRQVHVKAGEQVSVDFNAKK